MAASPVRWAFVAIAIVAVAVAVLAAAVWLPGRRAGAPVSFTASHVDLRLAVHGDGPSRVLEARFTPDSPDLHLYGPDLPAGGIDGAGRPTRVEIVPGGWTADGTAALAVIPTPYPTVLAGFSAPFSLLPDGPVVVSVPIARASGDGSVVRVAVTYMACSSAGRCYPPVTDQQLDVPVP